MFFKNATIYRLSPNFTTVAHLQEKLSAKPLQSCGQMDMSTAGWVSPTKDDRFVCAVGGQLLIALGVEFKLLPSGVVLEQADKKAKLIEEQQGFKPGRKQMKEIKEAVLAELLPKAFTRRRRTLAWIDLEAGWLVIDTPSPGRAEEVLDSLRTALDALPVWMLRTNVAPVSVMTSWLSANEARHGFTIDHDCELRAVTDEKAAVRYVRHALDGNDVKDHLAAGKLPTKIGLTYDDRVSFVLDDRMTLRRLQFLDIIKEEAEKQADGVACMQMEADFAIMSGELKRVIDALIAAMGGEDTNPPF